MHLIKLVACKTLQSFQSVFYAQCNFQKKKTFSSFIFDGNFLGRGTVYHCRASFWGPKITRKPASCRGASTVRLSPPALQASAFAQEHVAKKDTEAIVTRLDAPKSQKRFSESVKQGPDSGQNFGAALHKFADPKLGPKTVPETGPLPLERQGKVLIWGPFLGPKLNPKTSPLLLSKTRPFLEMCVFPRESN